MTGYEVTLRQVPARATAVVAATATWAELPGLWGQLAAAHDAVVTWCAEQGHRLDGARWEVYGPHDDDPAQQWTEVYWRLADTEQDHVDGD